MTKSNRRGRIARRTGCAITIAATLAMAGLPTFAAAQDTDPFGSILARPRPEFGTPPIIVGSFEITPRIDADVTYIDNLFASDVLEVSDVELKVTPRVTVRDRRSDRQLRLDLSAGYATYLDNQVDSRLVLRATGDARFGLGTRTRPFGGFRLQQNDTTSRRFEQFTDTAQPIKLTSYGANAGLEQEFGPITATGEGRYDKTDYQSETVIAGVPFASGFRDFDSASARVRLAYSVNPAQRFYVQGELTSLNFDDAISSPGTSPIFNRDRSSSGYSLRAGFARQLTELLLLDVNVGYLEQNYDDPALDTVNALSFEGNLFYSPTRLIRIQASASRLIDDTVNPFFNGLLRTEVGLAGQYEARRDLILFAETSYTDIAASETDAALDNDINGDGSEFRVGAGARYFVSPRWAVRLWGEHFSRSSIFEGTQNRITIGASYNF